MTDLLELAMRAASFEMMLNVLNWWLDENHHGNLRIWRKGPAFEAMLDAQRSYDRATNL